MTTREAFHKAYGNSTNFMTPDFKSLERVGKYAVEVSTGQGFTGEKIWGVSIVTLADGKKCQDLSQLCHSMSEVNKVLGTLRAMGGV